MKRILTSVVLLFSIQIFAARVPQSIPHFDLEMTGEEWREVLAQRRSVFGSTVSGPLDKVLNLGKRNLDWLRFINSGRTSKISLTDPSTTKGIPIESPKEYSDKTALLAYDHVIAQMPPSMKKVLVDLEPFTPDPGVSDADYIKWGHQIDVVYQTGARWLTMEPWLGELVENKTRDVRGHYFLSKDPNRNQNFATFASLPVDVKNNYSNWLVANCVNDRGDERGCRDELSIAESSRTISLFYDKYKRAAAENWKSFFKIPDGIRFSSLTWDQSNPNLAVIPFTDMGDQTQKDYLSVNIEDEWKWLGWQLRLDFASTAAKKVNVHWEPGITPHVEDLGSSEVYMDSNAPLTEYDVRWTIRHEFGHVVGFPDCYLEFYDPTRKLIVSYQHDVTDLMCARSGHFKQNHFDEMKRVYFR